MRGMDPDQRGASPAEYGSKSERELGWCRANSSLSNCRIVCGPYGSTIISSATGRRDGYGSPSGGAARRTRHGRHPALNIQNDAIPCRAGRALTAVHNNVPCSRSCGTRATPGNHAPHVWQLASAGVENCPIGTRIRRSRRLRQASASMGMTGYGPHRSKIYRPRSRGSEAVKAGETW